MTTPKVKVGILAGTIIVLTLFYSWFLVDDNSPLVDYSKEKCILRSVGFQYAVENTYIVHISSVLYNNTKYLASAKCNRLECNWILNSSRVCWISNTIEHISIYYDNTNPNVQEKSQYLTRITIITIVFLSVILFLIWYSIYIVKTSG